MWLRHIHHPRDYLSISMKDGIWNEDSFTSTGWQESYVEEVLGGTVRTGDSDGTNDNALGNGQTSYGYALKGIEFTILRVADIVTFTESANDDHPEYNMTQVLYGFDKTASADLLKAIGLENGANRYENADATDKLDSNNYYYTSDVLNKALADAVAENATTVKNALSAFRLVYQVDHRTVHELTCKDLQELNEYLANLEFDQMIAHAEERFLAEPEDVLDTIDPPRFVRNWLRAAL